VPNEPAVEGRLAVILAGDLLGYSRLMGADEAGTLSALKAIRGCGELADSTIAAHYGRIAKIGGSEIARNSMACFRLVLVIPMLRRIA
jgi:adenylate cyclase